MQTLAVRVDGHCLISACPGAGKTTVLVHRASRLLTNPDVRVLGVTFSSDSAAELDRRVKKHLAGKNPRDRFRCGTFHALCKRQIEASGRSLKLVTGPQQLDLIRRAYTDVIAPGEGMPTFDDALAFVEATKATVDPLHSSASAEAAFAVYTRYQELLGQLGANDFADLLLLAVEGMRDGSIKPYNVTHLLIDEFQDIDEVQMQWMRHHLDAGIEVTVVGDDDQSIFGWRRAMGYRALESFSRMGAALIQLDTTYRCASSILDHAGRLIELNPDRLAKSLSTANKNRGAVSFRQYKSREAELEDTIVRIAATGDLSRWVVLARTNVQLEKLEEQIAGRIPVLRTGGTSFWDLRGPALFLAMCRSLAFGDMLGIDEALKRMGVGESKLAEVHVACKSTERGALQRFLALDGDTEKTPIGLLRQRLKQWHALSFKSDPEVNASLTAIALFIFEHVPLYKTRRKAEDHERDRVRLLNCARALSRLRGPLRNRVASFQADSSPEMTDALTLMTLHGSKGLEFDHVWMIGCEEGVLPSALSLIEEERRLCYVGMTRARETLTMSCVIDKKVSPSRFLVEAGLFEMASAPAAEKVTAASSSSTIPTIHLAAPAAAAVAAAAATTVEDSSVTGEEEPAQASLAL